MKILVTGAAGFIGFHTAMKLLNEGYEVVGLDNINDYYSPQLKYDRLQELGVPSDDIKWYTVSKSSIYPSFRFVRMNLEDKQQLFDLFHSEGFDYIINLAAQAGVRYSIENPDVYIHSNILGFYNILEACRRYPVKHLIHASSSSVYGMNAQIPFSEDDKADYPVSLYAATKKSNELFAHSYSHLYDIHITCLRFFTVYGPWGRPDMAPMLFAKAISEGQPIKVFNNGDMSRDFTYIDDIVHGVVKSLKIKLENNEKFRVLNIGNGNPVKLMDFIKELEKGLGIPANRQFLPMQPGDVHRTWANIERLKNDIMYIPSITMTEGVLRFMEWFKEYYLKETNCG